MGISEAMASAGGALAGAGKAALNASKSSGSGGGTNIVEKYNWTAIPSSSKLRKEAPYVDVVVYKLNQPALVALAKGYLNLKDNANGENVFDFYDGMYKATKVKTYKFPFFTDDIRSFGNNFADTFSNTSHSGQARYADIVEMFASEANALIGLTGEGKQTYDYAMNAAKNSSTDVKGEGTYIETPKFYQFENTDNSLSVAFTLSNTLGGISDVNNNQEFIKEFTKLNRPHRKGAITFEFPHIYEITVPGSRYIRWAALENLSIGYIGARKIIEKKVVPEGYSISMSFKSLTIESSNFMDRV